LKEEKFHFEKREKLMNDFYDFFQKLTTHEPYNFQQKVADNLLDGKNVILQAPTGSGKTWASIAPFVFCWKQWKEGKQNPEDFPRKLIYSLPLRTLANSLYKEVKEKIETNLPDLEPKLNIKIQTGERPDDVLFEGDIIFTTIDQTLSNILGIPLSLPKKLANINAGAVLSSYLVFDEFHLLDPKRSLDTVVSLLKAMKSITPFCLMTATLSENFLTKTADYLDAEIINVKKEDYNRFDFVKNKAEKFITVSEKCLDIETIIENHNKQSIVICNTVERCKRIFLNLLEEKNKGRIYSELICIHSQFFHSDRKRKEKQILEYCMGLA
jgi:CRISPR-associated endonuclease/helicase Cas3